MWGWGGSLLAPIGTFILVLGVPPAPGQGLGGPYIRGGVVGVGGGVCVPGAPPTLLLGWTLGRSTPLNCC